MREMKRIRRFFLCSLASALAMLAVAATGAKAASSATKGAATQVFDRTYPLRAGGAFALENVNGGVRIEGWDQPEVEVRAVKTALHRSEDLNLVRIQVADDGDQAGVNTLYPSGSGVEVTVEYEIHVPYQLRWAAINTVNGDVHVRGISGAGILNSVNGNVVVLDSKGRFSGGTTNGDVRMQLSSMPDGEPMKLTTINGSVVLSVPEGTNMNLRVANRNGNFRSDFPLITLGAYSSKRFHGQLGNGGGEVFMSSVNGAIRLINGRPVI